MALIPCPDCGLPRIAADVAATPCPVCGRREPEPTPVALEPPPIELLPAEPESRSVRNWVLLVVVGTAGVGTLVAILALSPPDRPADATDSVTVASLPLSPLSPSLPTLPPARRPPPRRGSCRRPPRRHDRRRPSSGWTAPLVSTP